MGKNFLRWIRFCEHYITEARNKTGHKQQLYRSNL